MTFKHGNNLVGNHERNKKLKKAYVCPPRDMEAFKTKLSGNEA